jgi:phosphoglycerate kinase
MILPGVEDFDLKNKRVLLRVNYDVSLQNNRLVDSSRVDESLSTIKCLLGQGSKITLISHLGRPEGQEVSTMSLKPVADYLSRLLPGIANCYLRENLRFDPREEANNPEFARELAHNHDFFVNDAFAASHREHASIVTLPQLLPSAFGFDFLEEIANLSKILENPARPAVLVLGGAKEDKLDNLAFLAPKFDSVIIGGRLPLFFHDSQFSIHNSVLAELTSSGKDITQESLDKFQKIIASARTIVLAGPMSLYEEIDSEVGTKSIFEAIAQSSAFTVAGGGDTEAALDAFALRSKISYISSGGGAMLAFLAHGTLPGIEAIIKKNYQFSKSNF